MTTETLETRYGLPAQIRFCTRCVMSNQRPSSYPEARHTRDRKTLTLHIDDEGVCDACRAAEIKNQIDWKERERQLWALCDQHRRDDGSYDCLVPGSGGKDSALQAHVLKYTYGMHPLTVTWPPILYTDYGLENFRNWIEIGGFDNITFKPNGRVQKTLTRLSIQNLLHPFQTFILGQKNLGPRIAVKYGIELVFYGENEAEYGNPLADNSTSLRDKGYFTMENVDDVYLAGVSTRELREVHGIDLADLMAYLPAPAEEIERAKIEVHYLGYYLKWTPQESYYYAVEHTGFKGSRPGSAGKALTAQAPRHG